MTSEPVESPPLRTLKLVIEYEGTAYQGWQYQPDVPTIQGAIEACLERILGAPHRIHGSGRTDAGVHARGQVAHLRTGHHIAPEALHRALNATLPRDIAVRLLEEATPGFHARKQAHRKQYAYQILNRPHRSALLERYAWHLHMPLDLEAMQRASGLLRGVHDFSAFRAADCAARNPVRRIDAAGFQVEGEGLIRFEVEGNGFLKHMVRTIVGSLVEVGKGRWSVGDFQRVLEGKDRRRAGKTAPAKGLFLEWVAYDGGEPLNDEA